MNRRKDMRRGMGGGGGLKSPILRFAQQIFQVPQPKSRAQEVGFFNIRRVQGGIEKSQVTGRFGSGKSFKKFDQVFSGYLINSRVFQGMSVFFRYFKYLGYT